MKASSYIKKINKLNDLCLRLILQDWFFKENREARLFEKDYKEIYSWIEVFWFLKNFKSGVNHFALWIAQLKRVRTSNQVT